MTDDSNNTHDDSSASGWSGSLGRSSRPAILRRALRWETFALAAVLVVLALVFA